MLGSVSRIGGTELKRKRWSEVERKEGVNKTLGQ